MMRNNKATELTNYCKDCEKANLLQQQIQTVEDEISRLEKAIEVLEVLPIGITDLLAELRAKRLELHSLELAFNTVDRRIIQFQLAEELAE